MLEGEVDSSTIEAGSVLPVIQVNMVGWQRILTDFSKLPILSPDVY
jgi:hypothetical protein